MGAAAMPDVQSSSAVPIVTMAVRAAENPLPGKCCLIVPLLELSLAFEPTRDVLEPTGIALEPTRSTLEPTSIRLEPEAGAPPRRVCYAPPSARWRRMYSILRHRSQHVGNEVAHQARD
jgi:hypothetical protein